MAPTDPSPNDPPPPPAGPHPLERLEAGLREAIARVTGLAVTEADPQLAASRKPEFGDFQANFAMKLGKAREEVPRELASAVVDALDLDELIEPPEVAGPGFVNLRLRPSALTAALEAMASSELGVAASTDVHPVVVDMCGVNVSKQLHVGHLRSTIIGDCLARVFEALGRRVHRENHLGDWGLPIAMVLDGLRRSGTTPESVDLTGLDAAYRSAQLEAKADTRGLARAVELGAGPHRIAELEEQNAGARAVQESARSALVRLQGGDAELVAQWRALIRITMTELDTLLGLLHVDASTLTSRGESTYRDRLPDVVDAFVRASLGTEDEGAIVVPFEDRERPLLIRKSDGGFLYATTDLAAIEFRVRELEATEVIYIVDARQRDHFRDVFDAARAIGWDHTPDGAPARLVHRGFGTVLGPDGKPLKTRSGDNVKLRDLVEEAIRRGTAEVTRRATDPSAPTHGLAEAELGAIGHAVGVGAIKYADLSNDLVKDYVFSFDRMITFEGNTGPYLQYSHARICSIFRKAGLDADARVEGAVVPSAPEERALALKLLRFGEVVHGVARTLQPHLLCTYLYELANTYSAFYQACPVLQAADEETRTSRLRLCGLTRRVMARGLDLLGIEAPQRM